MKASKRILVVDDSRSARAYVMDAIKKDGYEVSEAGSGLEALEHLEKGKPDGIVLDLLMPDMDGFEFLRQLKVKGISLPVLVLTADIQEEVKNEVLELGAKAMLNKPVDMGVLLETLKSITK